MTLVGLISDTHGQLPDKAYEALADCQHIIHAGDIGHPRVLHLLEALAPVTAVWGNNDMDEYGGSVSHYAHPIIDGVQFLVTHYPRDARVSVAGTGALAPGDPLPQVCVHGHTHVPEIVTGADAGLATYLVCPGAVYDPRGDFPRCVGHMLVEKGVVQGIRISSLSGDTVFETGCLL